MSHQILSVIHLEHLDFKLPQVKIYLAENSCFNDKSMRNLKVLDFLNLGPSVQLNYNSSGRLMMSGGGDLSLSHKSSHLLWVYSKDRFVGCDLEYLGQKIDWEYFKKYYFSKSEIESVLSCEQNPHAMFFLLFSAKEALYKAAQGYGMNDQSSLTLSGFESGVYSWEHSLVCGAKIYSFIYNEFVVSVCLYVDEAKKTSS